MSHKMAAYKKNAVSNKEYLDGYDAIDWNQYPNSCVINGIKMTAVIANDVPIREEVIERILTKKE